MYRIQTTDGQTYDDRFDTIDDAAKAYAEMQGWDGHVVCDEFHDHFDADGIERYACCVYETQEQCDERNGPATAIIECGTIDW